MHPRIATLSFPRRFSRGGRQNSAVRRTVNHSRCSAFTPPQQRWCTRSVLRSCTPRCCDRASAVVCTIGAPIVRVIVRSSVSFLTTIHTARSAVTRRSRVSTWRTDRDRFAYGSHKQSCHPSTTLQSRAPTPTTPSSPTLRRIPSTVDNNTWLTSTGCSSRSPRSCAARANGTP